MGRGQGTVGLRRAAQDPAAAARLLARTGGSLERAARGDREPVPMEEDAQRQALRAGRARCQLRPQRRDRGLQPGHQHRRPAQPGRLQVKGQALAVSKQQHQDPGRGGVQGPGPPEVLQPPRLGPDRGRLRSRRLRPALHAAAQRRHQVRARRCGQAGGHRAARPQAHPRRGA